MNTTINTNQIEYQFGNLMSNSECATKCAEEQMVFYSREVLIVPSLIVISLFMEYLMIQHPELLHIPADKILKYVSYIHTFNIALTIGFLLQFLYFIPN